MSRPYLGGELSGTKRTKPNIAFGSLFQTSKCLRFMMITPSRKAYSPTSSTLSMSVQAIRLPFDFVPILGRGVSRMSRDIPIAATFLRTDASERLRLVAATSKGVREAANAVKRRSFLKEYPPCVLRLFAIALELPHFPQPGNLFRDGRSMSGRQGNADVKITRAYVGK
jgi:hypothetical protein